MTTKAIDEVFGGGAGGVTVEISVTKAADLIRGAVSKAAAEGVDKATAAAVTKRAYHLTKAMDAALDASQDGETVSVDKDLLEAVETDAADATVSGSMSEAMDRLAKAMAPKDPVNKSGGTPGNPRAVDQGGEPPSQGAGAGDGGGAADDGRWPSDLNAPADSDGLDDWGNDPDFSASEE